jgi:hypothetical protein
MAQEGSLHSRFYGTWKLVGVDRTDPESGEKLGLSAVQTGYICYTDERRVMVLISRQEPNGEPAEFTSYAGTWEIESDAVVHSVEMATRKPWVGTRQVRHFVFEGNRLILTPPTSLDFNHNKITQRSLSWEKLS